MKKTGGRKFHIQKPGKRVLRLLIAVGICLLLFLALTVFRSKSTSALPDMHGAERFAPEGGYAQIGCYFAERVTVEPERYREFNYRVESALTTNSIGKDEDNPDARLFLDCYSMEGSVTLVHERKTVEAKAIGTGGDFFFFHPVELVSGMHYMVDALMKDQVLIDETVAWQLFGGYDVAGQTVEIGGTSYVVSGVAKSGSGRMLKAAGSEGALVFLPAEGLRADGALRHDADRINCYELIMPDPVDGFAAKLIRETLGFDEESMHLADQTKRFGSFSLLSVLTDYGTRSMTGAAISYPYWENLARGTEDILAPVVVLQALCLLVPVILIVIEIVHRYRHKEWTAQGIVTKIGDSVYNLRAKKYAEKKKKKINTEKSG